MASRIPIRRVRTTAGPENENVNVRSSQASARAKALGRGGTAIGSSKAAAVAPDAAVASGKECEGQSSAKRKREALREVTEMRNWGPEKGKSSQVRKILGLPKKSTQTTTDKVATARAPLRTVPAADENVRQSVFVAPPAVGVSEDPSRHRRSSSTRSLIPVVQREKEVDLDDEPSSKRQRTSSVGPEELEEVAAELGVYADEDADEADPDGTLWDDFDANDDDPLMASEYVNDIQQYLKQTELNTMPNPRYMASQPKLTWEMRGMLIEWLLQVHARFRLTQETLFLTTNLIDRFLSARVISPSKIQLVGMGCMLIASKFEETVSPAILNFIQVSEGTYTAADMLQAEQHILRTLEWDLSFPSPVNFLRRISKVDEFEVQTRTVAKYLAEISCVDHHLMSAPPSMLAAAAMWLARLALGEEKWTHNHAHYSMYRESELVPVANYMVRYLLQPIRHEYFYKKYAAKRNMKVSVYMRQWALARWDEGTKVDLAPDLDDIKREIRQKKRERAIRQAAAARESGETEEEEIRPSEDTIDLGESDDAENVTVQAG